MLVKRKNNKGKTRKNNKEMKRKRGLEHDTDNTSYRKACTKCTGGRSLRTTGAAVD
jgi:hypothetical protein